VDPRQRLWRRLADYFAPGDDIVHATPDVELTGVSPHALERIWRRLTDDAEPLGESTTVWDVVAERSVPAVELLNRGLAEATARCSSLLVPLVGVRVGSIRLPYLGVFLYPDGIGFFWWVGRDPWDEATIGAFAELLGELMRIAPEATPTSEWDEYGEGFWSAIDEYLDATR
jgi:hypothetical protein